MINILLSIFKKISIHVVKKLWSIRKRLINTFLCNIKYRNTKIRLSISYLYKIKLDNKYLLVKSQRIPNQFQPVGGVYKTKKGTNKLFHELKVLSDDGYAYDNDLKDDLRIRVPGKNVMKFISWFESDTDRENNPLREFREELLDTTVLVPRQAFENIDYNFLERNISKLHFSPNFQCLEILIKDIYEYIPNEEQEEILRNIFDKETDYYRWFEQDEIISLGRTKDKREFRVGEHTLDILY